jgi:urease accessory protein
MPFSRLFSSKRLTQCALVMAALAAANSTAFAHPGLHVAGFTDGLAHPFSGLDHMLAMVAVGLWAAQLGRPATWVLPLAFPAVMAIGAIVGWSGGALPWMEIGVTLSVVVLGVAVAFGFRPSLIVSTALIAMFAFFHGYTHGVELSPSASALTYAAGFIAATLTLHAIGLALGAGGRGALPRVAGSAVAAMGVVLILT